MLVLGMLTILTVMLAEFEDESSSEAAAALADRDALKAEYSARSAVNLGRLLIASEPTIRTAIGPLLGMALGGGGVPQIPVWEFSDRILGAFNDREGAMAFQSLAGVDPSTGKNLGIAGSSFNVVIVDETARSTSTWRRGRPDHRAAVGVAAARVDAGRSVQPDVRESRRSRQPERSRDRLRSADRLGRTDEQKQSCDPRNSQNTGGGVEDAFYQSLKYPYRRKNAPYDSLEELHLVRGITDDFFSTFIDPNPDNPKQRVLTVWWAGDGQRQYR